MIIMLHHVLAALILVVKLIVAQVKAIYRLFVWPPRVSIAGKVVLITGSGSGLGREIALRLAAEGARLVLWDITEKGNIATSELIHEACPNTELHLHTVDVTNRDVVKATALKVQTEIGQVYMLVNNAGVLVGETLLELTEGQIQRTINVNLLSQFWMLRAFLPAMLEADSGHIVTTCSTAGQTGMHRQTDYSASKFGVFGLDESLASELKDVYKKRGIKQTLVCPHVLDTGLIHSVNQRFLGESKVSEAADAIVDQVLRQFRYVYYPELYRYAVTARGLFSHEASLAAMDFINVQVASQKGARVHKD